EFSRVTFGKKVLDVNIADVNLLMARLKRIQPAVGVLLKKVEPGQVVIDAVRTQVAEQADAGLLFGENEPAKIADELLDSGANGDEIKIRAQVVDLGFDKSFLQAGVAVKAVGTVSHIYVDQPPVACLQKIEIEFRCKANAEINRPKTGIAFKQIERKAETLRGEALLTPSEEVITARLLGGNTARHGQATH